MPLRLTPRSRVWFLGMGAVWFCSEAAFALTTGVPVALAIDPVIVRQREQDTTPLVATVTLQGPSPSFFVCKLRSSDESKVSFSTIIFRKGDLREQGPGAVHWKNVMKDTQIRVLAYSTDAPDRQASFQVTLKLKAADEIDTPREDPK